MSQFCRNGCGRIIESGPICEICEYEFKKVDLDFTPLDKLEQIEK